jgi:hypothetical protein
MLPCQFDSKLGTPQPHNQVQVIPLAGRVIMWGWAIPPNAEFVGIYLYACTATKSVTQLQDAPFVASMVYLPQNFECKV